MLLHGEATLYTSTAAFSEPKPRRSLLQLIKDFNDKNTKTMLYGMAVRKYMESLPTEEELMEQGVIKWVSEKGTPLVVDKKANYNLALNPIINLGRYMDLLRDDVAMHAKHGKPIKSVTAYVHTHYAALPALLEECLFDDYAKVQWDAVKHLEAIGFIVYWDRKNNSLVIRWDQNEITV